MSVVCIQCCKVKFDVDGKESSVREFMLDGPIFGPICFVGHLNCPDVDEHARRLYERAEQIHLQNNGGLP